MTLILLTFKSRHLKEKVQTSLYCRLATDQGFIRGVYLCLCYYYFFRNQIYNYGMVTDHVDTFRHLVQKIAEFLFGDFSWSTMNKKPTRIDFFCFWGDPDPTPAIFWTGCWKVSTWSVNGAWFLSVLNCRKWSTNKHQLFATVKFLFHLL